VLTLITGPVRSGKSTLAQRLAAKSGKRVVFCATGMIDPDDPEWMARIERHRAERPKEWEVIETAVPGGTDLLQALTQAKAGEMLVIDSIGTWVSGVMGRHPRGTDIVAWQDQVEEETLRMLDVLESCAAEVVAVSEETGWDIHPVSAVGRVFRDVMGRTNRRLCARAQRAYLIVCGVALDLKKGAPVETLE
jgi:adenosylcobinamide kinase / adenosylcobinamide-phosphate guanylyltransferase